MNVRTIVSGRFTRGYQRKVGVENAKGDIIAFINADCVADATA